MPHFIEFDLELVDLADDFSEAGDFSVGVGDGGGGAGGLMRGGALGLGCELLWGRERQLSRIWWAMLQFRRKG